MAFRAAVILLFLSGSLNSHVTVAQEDAHDLERKVDQVFAAYDKPASPGCALGVIRDGEFLYKRAYGSGSLEMGVNLTPQSIFYLASVSKQFTAASVVLAAEQGYLSLDDDVRKYIPELPFYGHATTLRQMLHHTSGYRDDLALLRLAGGNFEDVHSTAEMLDLVSRQKALNYIPGSEYLYSNTNFFLMSVVIQRVTGRSLSQFAAENIFKPLGMSHTQFYDDRTEVVPGRVPAYKPLAAGRFGIDWSTNFDEVGDGGLFSSVEDLLIWDHNFYADKLSNGTLLRELQTPGVLNSGKQIEYALGLFIGTYRGLPTVEHSGGLFGYRTELLRFPVQKFSVICLCNLASIKTRILANQVADIYLQGQLSPEHPAATVLHVDPRAFTGRYRNLESHSVLDLSVAQAGLAAGGQQFEPLGPRRFAAASGAELTFEFRGGKPAALTLTATDTLSRRYEKFQASEPSAKNLAQYAGVYSSSELPATYRFASRDGHLSLAVNWQEPTVLIPAVLDEFQDPVLGISIVFRRDATGQVEGCDIFSHQVRHISFAKAVPAMH